MCLYSYDKTTLNLDSTLIGTYSIIRFSCNLQLFYNSPKVIKNSRFICLYVRNRHLTGSSFLRESYKSWLILCCATFTRRKTNVLTVQFG